MPRIPFVLSPCFCCLAAALILVSLPAAAIQTKPGMPRAERHESRHEIDQLEENWKNAVIHRNVQAMDALLADDYIGITSNGTLQSKDQTLQSLKSGTLKLTSIEFSDRKVRFYGKTALVTTRAEVSGSAVDGNISGGYRYTRVYARDDKGAWKIVSFEASRIQLPDEHK